MRFCRKNKRQLYYANFVESQPIYELDENGNKIVVDTIDGVDYYQEIGHSEPTYGAIVPFMATIREGGTSKATEIGLDMGLYDAEMVLPTDCSDIDEKTLIWAYTKPQTADPSTADYYVEKKLVAINCTKFGLTRVVK